MLFSAVWIFFSFQSDNFLRELQPRFVVTGSVAEGTRIGLANELDIILEFDNWKPLLVVSKKDPFQLYSTGDNSDSIKKYFDSAGRFSTNDFVHDLLELVCDKVDEIYEAGRNPPQLERVTRNSNRKCSECHKRLAESKERNTVFVQCPLCAVTVSQTKAGICLQFQWKQGEIKIYSSVDIIPMYNVKEIESIALARSVNTGILLQRSDVHGWLKYLRSYVKTDMVVEGLSRARQDSPKVKSVFLKQLDPDNDVYFIRPGQVLGSRKFFSKKHHLSYQLIKFFKKSLHLEAIDMYMVKKLLWKPEVTMIHYETVVQREFVLRVLGMPELRRHFEPYINFQLWESRNAIEINLCTHFP